MTAAPARPPLTATITVTQDHIDNGMAGNCARCPVALAILDAVPGVFRAEVWYDREDDDQDLPLLATLWFGDLEGSAVTPSATTALPLPADEFVVAFDGGAPVAPFAFEMEVTRP